MRRPHLLRSRRHDDETTKGTTTVTLTFPDNLTHPPPGIESGVGFADATFPEHKVGSGKKAKYYMSSTKCTGQRQFTFTVVDEEGPHPLATDAGDCK